MPKKPLHDSGELSLQGEILPVRPLHFMLECESGKALYRIKRLFAFAQELDIEIETGIEDLRGDDCAVLPCDPLEALKAMAFLIVPQGLSHGVCAMPDRLLGFSATLPNHQTLHVGLAQFEGVDRFRNVAYWHGYVQTIVPVVSSFSDCLDRCVNSHRSVISLLSEARNDGMRVGVFDPVMFWEIRDENRLRRAISRSFSDLSGFLEDRH